MDPMRQDNVPCVQTRLRSARDYKIVHRAEILEWQRKYNTERFADPVRRAKKLLQDKESRKRNAVKRAAYDRQRYGEKQRAQRLIRNLIYRDGLKRQPCCVCGEPKADAHHEDYNAPRSIVWLCRLHHKAVHLGTIQILKEQIENV